MGRLKTPRVADRCGSLDAATPQGRVPSPVWIPDTMNLNPLRRAAGLAACMLAASLGAAELPAPLAEAVTRLSGGPAYAYTWETQMPGAPFAVAPMKGWAAPGGAALVEATADRKSVKVATLGSRRAVRLAADWKTPSEADPGKGAVGVEVARLLALPAPHEHLAALLAGAAAFRLERDGSYRAELDANVAAAILTANVEGRAPGGFTPEIRDATASVRVWLSGGALWRYVTTTSARLALPFGTKDIQSISTVELREIPAAEAALPPDALVVLRARARP